MSPLSSNSTAMSSTDTISNPPPPPLANSIIVFAVIALTFGLFYYLMILFRRSRFRATGVPTSSSDTSLRNARNTDLEMDRRSILTLPEYARSPEYQKEGTVLIAGEPPIYERDAQHSSSALL